jgi:hypothetical protein
MLSYGISASRPTQLLVDRLERIRSPREAVAAYRRHTRPPAAEVNTAVQEMTDELQQADAGVRAHEAAHLAAAGAYASGGATYSYARGPDGRLYAVGGSVQVNLSPVPGDPEATIRKAKALIQAAYAVGQPSAADLRVAAEAYQMEMEAARQLDSRRQRAGGREPGTEIAVA